MADYFKIMKLTRDYLSCARLTQKLIKVVSLVKKTMMTIIHIAWIYTIWHPWSVWIFWISSMQQKLSLCGIPEALHPILTEINKRNCQTKWNNHLQNGILRWSGLLSCISEIDEDMMMMTQKTKFTLHQHLTNFHNNFPLSLFNII